MKITSLERVPRTPVNMTGVKNACKQVPVGTAEGAPNFVFRVFTLAPEGHTPYHEHPWEHVNYVISGTGILVDADGRRHPLATGDFAYVEPGEKHQYRNAHETDDFVLVCAVPEAYE